MESRSPETDRTPASATPLPNDPVHRSFMQGAPASAATLAAAGTASLSRAQSQTGRTTPSHYQVPATDKTVHRGHFSKNLKPVLGAESDDFVTIETVTHHARDDFERMIEGDPGVENIHHWNKSRKGVNRRGAGEGLGVHVCTGPVAIKGAEPGDILEVRILDVRPRPSANPKHAGKTFGSHLADLGAKAQSEIYRKSSIDLALRDAFRKMRHFLMTAGLHRRRSDLADIGGGGIRCHPGRGRQPGHSRRGEERHLRQRESLARPAAVGQRAEAAAVSTGPAAWRAATP